MDLSTLTDQQQIQMIRQLQHQLSHIKQTNQELQSELHQVNNDLVTMQQENQQLQSKQSSTSTAPSSQGLSIFFCVYVCVCITKRVPQTVIETIVIQIEKELYPLLQLHQVQTEYINALERELQMIDLSVMSIGDLQRLYKIFLTMMKKVSEREELLLRAQETHTIVHL